MKTYGRTVRRCGLILGVALALSGCSGGGSDGSAPPPPPTPLTVVSTAPAAGAPAVPVSSTISVVFSIAVDPATLSSTTFAVTTGAGAVAGVIGYTAATRTAVFTPAANLAGVTLHTINLTAGILGTTGLSLAPHNFTFTTAPTPLTVPSNSPANGAGGVAVNSTITATFNVGVNPATLTAATFTVNDGGADLAGTIAYNAPAMTATFTPAAAMNGPILHTVNLSSGIMSTEGASLAPFAFTFTTSAAPDTTPPVFAGATSATATSPTTITVSWTAATDNVDPSAAIVYRVYRALASGAQNFGAPDAVTAPGAVSFNDTGRTPGTSYFYVVRAVDSSANAETNLVERTAMTPAPDTTPPTFSGASSASAPNAVRVVLSWTAATDNVDPSSAIFYRIYRATASGAQTFGAPTATTPAAAVTYVDNGLAPNPSYFYVVRAVDSSGNEDGNLIEQVAAMPAARRWNLDIWTPMINGTCTGCHGGSGGLSLTPDAATARNNLVNVDSGCPPLKRVLPGDAAASHFFKKLEGTQTCGSRMPLTGPPFFNAAQLDVIRDWIDEGAPNN